MNEPAETSLAGEKLDETTAASSSNPTVAPSAGANAPAPAVTAPSTTNDVPAETSREDEEERWYLKTIHWPPLPRAPSGHEADLPSVRIICQNKNGPCSLLALCNILILRHEVSIPHRQDYVTYSDLSTFVADYLLAQPSPHLSLERALQVLPTTRYGLSLNPRFGSIDGFAPSSFVTESGRTPVEGAVTTSDEVLLFKACGIQLVHGWVPDPQDEQVWSVMVERHGDYDEAVKAMVEGEGLVDIAGRDDDAVALVEAQSKLGSEDQRKASEALLIRSFLDASSTQLTINGLFRLSTDLAPGSLVALFRNSHLSVLFVRPASPNDNDDVVVPRTFELVTDDGMRGSAVVWESLVDTSGAGDWYDGALRRVSGNRRQLTDEELARRLAGHSIQSDAEYARVLAGQTPQTDEEYARSLAQTTMTTTTRDDADLARQLQREEDARAHTRPRRTEPASPSHAAPASVSSLTATSAKKTKKKDCVIS